MNQIFIISVIASSIMLQGCGGGGGGSGSDDGKVNIPDPTLTITSQNAEAVNEEVVSVIKGEVVPDIESLLSGDLAGGEARALSSSTESFSLISAQSTNVDETETRQCARGGSLSISLDGEVDEVQGDGNININAQASNCAQAVGLETTTELDGVIKGPIEFEGFDGFNFDRLSYRLDVEGLSVSRFLGSDLDEFRELSGRETGSTQNGLSSVDYFFSLVSNQIGGERVTIETTKSIKGDFSGLISGEWRVQGADGTVITYVVVANGVEFQVNDQQAELISRAELGL